MKVPHSKGVANHAGPESCVGHREVRGEALTGERAGQPLSRERSSIRVPTPSDWRKATRTSASSRVPVRPGVVGDPGMHARSLHGNREISSLAVGASCGRRSASGRRGADADDARAEKSDLAVVAMKPANKAGSPAAEAVEPREGTKGNADQPRTRRTQSRESVSQGLERVRQAARQRKRQSVHGAAAPRHRRCCCERRSWRSSAVPHRAWMA